VASRRVHASVKIGAGLGERDEVEGFEMIANDDQVLTAEPGVVIGTAGSTAGSITTTRTRGGRHECELD